MRPWGAARKVSSARAPPDVRPPPPPPPPSRTDWTCLVPLPVLSGRVSSLFSTQRRGRAGHLAPSTATSARTRTRSPSRAASSSGECSSPLPPARLAASTCRRASARAASRAATPGCAIRSLATARATSTCHPRPVCAGRGEVRVRFVRGGGRSASGLYGAGEVRVRFVRGGGRSASGLYGAGLKRGRGAPPGASPRGRAAARGSTSPGSRRTSPPQPSRSLAPAATLRRAPACAPPVHPGRRSAHRPRQLSPAPAGVPWMSTGRAGGFPPPPPSRTNWTRLVPSPRTNWTRLAQAGGL